MASVASEEDLECPICHELLTCPKLLPCYHQACRDCIVSWMKKGGQGGCPLCRASILSPTDPGQGHLDTCVDNLPTDLLTESLVKGHQVLTGPDVCVICPSNMVATSYCFECEQKICATCSDLHKKFRISMDHVLQDLNTITAQDLADHFQPPCQHHSTRIAEVYCCRHHELICTLCATTGHRSCPEVVVIADMAKEKRRELGQLVHTWRTQEAELAKKVRTRKDNYDQQWREVNKTFDDIQSETEKRRQELLDVIQKAEDGDRELDKLCAAMVSHTVAIERLLRSPCDGVVVHMATQLAPLSREVERRSADADKVKAVQEVHLDSQAIADLKSALSALGLPPSTTTTSAVSATSSPSGSVAMTSDTAVSATTATIATTPRSAAVSASTSATPTTTRTTHKPTGAAIASAIRKPTGAALASVLKVGNRVKLSDTGRRFWGYDRGPGTVTAFPSHRAAAVGLDPQGWVDVQWDVGGGGFCSMGLNNEYWLELC